MPPKSQPKFKAKILFLHGYTQSASIFYAKTSALRKRLNKLHFKTVYLNGPTRLTPADLPSSDTLSSYNSVASSNEITNYRSWWTKSNAGKFELEPAIETIRKYVTNGEIIPEEDVEPPAEETPEERELPIVGLVGFSQGAAFAGLIAHKFDEIFHTQPLKFAILYSGFKLDTSAKSGNGEYDSYYPTKDETNPNLRYLHIVGELDTVVGDDRALAFYDITTGNSDVLKHPGGHFVPNSRISIDQVTNWIQALENKKEEPEKDQKSKSDKDELDSLMDMMDGFGKA